MKRRHSLTWRLILLFIMTGLLISLSMRMGFRYGIQGELRSLAEPHLLEYIDHLRSEIGSPPDYPSAQRLAERLSLEIHAEGPTQNWSTHGKPPQTDDLSFRSHSLSDGTRIEIGRNEHRLVVRLDQNGHDVLLIPQRLTHSRQIPVIILLTILIVIVIIAFAYHRVKRMIRPVQSLRDGVSRFGSGQLDYRIPTGRQDELGELAASFNNMAGDIQQMLEAKRQLLLAISHELRSPLTRARLNAELLAESDSRQRIIRDLREMEEQLTEILETERLNSRHVKLDLGSYSPTSLIDEVIEQHFPGARFQRQEAVDPPRVQVDALRIRLLIKNLLRNALQHTPEDAAAPEIRSRFNSTDWLLSIKDHGPGIDPEHLPHLTEAFYRVDKSRQRLTGGFGLGLYLCRVIAEAHGGSLRITSDPGTGSEVCVTLPVWQVRRA
ncbi:MAG: HAMP domain-containing sensor histidine kinase [Gammaproteobacteria bacterium]|nr:HAMP domain-containing sensor histidine kinase [Gammaproteobacteria bacterium]